MGGKNWPGLTVSAKPNCLEWKRGGRPPNPREPMRGRLEILDDTRENQNTMRGRERLRGSHQEARAKPTTRASRTKLSSERPDSSRANSRPKTTRERDFKLCAVRLSKRCVYPRPFEANEAGQADELGITPCHSAAAKAPQVTPTGRHDKREIAQWRPNDDLESKRKPSRPRPAAMAC